MRALLMIRRERLAPKRYRLHVHDQELGAALCGVVDLKPDRERRSAAVITGCPHMGEELCSHCRRRYIERLRESDRG